jgi:hypothetical protein
MQNNFYLHKVKYEDIQEYTSIPVGKFLISLVTSNQIQNKKRGKKVPSNLFPGFLGLVLSRGFFAQTFSKKFYGMMRSRSPAGLNSRSAPRPNSLVV